MKNTTKNILLLIVVIILCLFFLEGFFRIFFADYSHTLGGPGMKKLIESTEFNNLGFRSDTDITTKTGPRIIILGDSMSFGHGIKETKNTWPAQLETKLKEQNPNVEVINTAWPGEDTETELLIYKRKAKQLNPDIVIIGYFLNDAETDESLKAREEHHKQFQSSSYIGNIFHAVFGKFFLENSYLYNMIIIFYDSLKQQTFEDSYINQVTTTYNGNLSLHQQQITNLIQEIRDSNAVPIVVTIPFFYNFEEYPFMNAHNFVENAAFENNAAYIDLLDNFKNKDASEYVIGKYDNHVNEEGSKIIADQIATFIATHELI
jgi:lysophospholipase L1-like esterase